MERGKPNVAVYTFEAGPGVELQYPDAELWTLDYDEARGYAQQRGYQLIANEYVFEDSEMLEDYTPAVECKYCGLVITQEPNDLWQDPDYDDADTRRYCDEAPDHLHAPARP